MRTELEEYIRKTARARGISLAEVARRAGMSRQALYDSWQVDRYPSMSTVMRLANALEVHPLAILEPMFRGQPQNNTLHQGASTGTDRSAFLADASYPDGSEVLAGTRFRKGWTLQNLGSLTWQDRFLSCQDESLRVLNEDGQAVEIAPGLTPDQRHVPIPTVAPGERVTIEVDFTAPPTPATVISYWKMTDREGNFCFPDCQGVWAKVRVITPIGAAEQAPPPAG